jgi:uncharacterized membrane protein
MSLLHWISSDSLRRFTVCSVIAMTAFFLTSHELRFPARGIIVWDTFALSATALAWLSMLITPQGCMRAHARAQDLSRLLIFGFVVTATCVALLAVGVLIKTHHAEITTGFNWYVVLALGTVALAWLLLHTVYSLHYAHVYYGDADENTVTDRGLEFPSDEPPDYLDFAYFSFVVGMTCQVSDVQVKSKAMRHLTLLHGVISFGFNTIILALLINTISGLL